jgi:hypothetical protein
MKSNKFKFILIALFGILAISSCDKVDDPYADQDQSEVIIDETVVYTTIVDESSLRGALIMDFTGHNCTNCPGAALEAENIHADYPEQVIVMAVHPTIDQLTTPLNFHPLGGFSTDWTTPVGEYLQGIYEIPQSIPKGVISGREIGGSYALNKGEWRGVVEGLITEALPAKIDVVKGYSPVHRSFIVDADITVNTDVEDGLAIVVALIESGMEDWQLNGTESFPSNPEYEGGEIENYEHKHVLRQHLNGIQGGDLSSTAVSAGATFTYSHSANISEDYIEENSAVIVYIYNKTTKEIYQAVEFHLID